MHKKTPEYKCSATAFVNPPIVLKVENEHTHGQKVLNEEVRSQENVTIKAGKIFLGSHFKSPK